MIPLSIPTYIGKEDNYVNEVFECARQKKASNFSSQCVSWIEEAYQSPNTKVFMTKSCTQSLEMAALLLEAGPGDEVIMPSFTHVSTANAFALRGSIPVFVDVEFGTMNLDPNLIEAAITSRTVGIIPVHYSGVAAEMNEILEIAEKHNLWVLEDAAHGIGATYKGRFLGTMGKIGTISFDHLKNVTCGQGGAILINDPALLERAGIIYEHGTDKAAMLKGEVSFYSWKGLGSNHYLSELSSAYLLAQLHNLDTILEQRVGFWNMYREGLASLSQAGKLSIPDLPLERFHNAHIFPLIANSIKEQKDLTAFLHKEGIVATFHYHPLHDTRFGRENARWNGDLAVTKEGAAKLIRLPLYHGITENEVQTVIKKIFSFFRLST